MRVELRPGDSDRTRRREQALLRAAAGWLERLWLPEAAWAPVHLAVLALLNPLMGAMALAGIAALAAMIAVGATGPASAIGGRSQLARLAGADSFGCTDGFLAGLGFCETVYRVLIVGLGAALLVRGDLEPGLFVAVSLIGIAAMRAVLPRETLVGAVGGVSDKDFAGYKAAGVSVFGLGSSLFKPGMTVAEVAAKTRAAVAAWDSAFGSTS